MPDNKKKNHLLTNLWVKNRDKAEREWLIYDP